MINFFSNLFQRNVSDPINKRRARNERLLQYSRYLRSYQGYSVRGVLNTNVIQDWRRVKFNFVQPVVNLSAGWFSAKPIDWTIDGNPDATKEAYRIWDRSGSDAALLESAILCGIYGDIVGLATQNEQGFSKIEFIDASIVEPVFDGSDYSSLRSAEIAFETRDSKGDLVVDREIYESGVVEHYLGETLIDRRTYETLPLVWIRNSSIKGLPYGLSDVEPILELVEEYDHLAAKQTRIVDYYASPNIIFSGVQKGTSQSEKSVGTVYYLPMDAKAYFLEWSGSGPDIEHQLTRIRNGIAEISQVPAVAFGSVDTGVVNISGVAIKILYGPLLSKTHRKQASWGPSLETLMWLCLRASGFDVALEAVNVVWPDATPVDGQARIAESSGKVAARLASRQTEMNNLGIENPDEELRRIVLEEKILQLATAGPDLASDANRAASLGARGRFVMEKPNESVTVADLTSTNDEDISHLMERFDALINQTELS